MKTTLLLLRRLLLDVFKRRPKAPARRRHAKTKKRRDPVFFGRIFGIDKKTDLLPLIDLKVSQLLSLASGKKISLSEWLTRLD